MNTAELLYEKYQQDLKRLQHRCKHKDLTDWQELYWDPGHSCGNKGKFCKVCHKMVKRKKPKLTTSDTNYNFNVIGNTMLP